MTLWSWKKLINSVNAISGRNSHCRQNFHSFKAEFYPLPELQLRPVLFRFVGCCLYLTTNYSFIQFDKGYFVFFMFITLGTRAFKFLLGSGTQGTCLLDYAVFAISKKLKNSDFEAKTKSGRKRAGMSPIPYGSVISNGHQCQRIRANLYR